MSIIIVGAGEVGSHVARRLSRENRDVVVIEKDENVIRRIADNLDVQIIHGSGSSPSILKKAGIESSEILMAVTNSDEVNMVACIIAASQAHVPVKIARLRDLEYEKIYNMEVKKEFNIDFVINPERESVSNILDLLDVPEATYVRDFAEGKVRLVGFQIREELPITNRKLIDIMKDYPDNRFLIAAISRGANTIIPRGKDRILPGDHVFFVSQPKYMPTMLHMINKEELKTKRVVIFGGGNIGFYLAKQLEKRGIHSKIIEENEERCVFLSENVENAVILHGNGTDQELLKEGSVKDADAFLGVSDDDEANILVSLFAKRMGAKRVMARLNNLSYLQLVSSLGIDVVISPRLAAVGSILHFIRKGRVLSVSEVGGEDAEAIEVIAMETSDLVNRPLKDIKFPSGSMVATVVRNDEVIIPSGSTVIHPGDRVILFSLRSSIPKLEKVLTVKLEYF
ncbi:MAG: Trk system potassium transporter TrkA [Thermodesulfobacteriota bacterium]|nr:Trk system potassium transporter TrkA [Thermodesulfobacteriota bacterium]